MDLIRVLEKGTELYNIEFESGVEYQFRLLSMREYRLFNKFITGGLEPPIFIYEQIFNLCFLGDSRLFAANSPIGPMITVGQLIYHMSGSQDATQLLVDIAQQRKENPGDNIFSHMRAVIITAIPRYTLFDVDNLTEKEFIKCFVIAENILSKVNPAFQRLDLKEIYDKMHGIKEEEAKPVVQKENIEQLEQALGHWKVEEARQLYEQEQRKVKLSSADLEALEKAKRG